MTYRNPALSYQQTAARGTTPVGQVVALYDTILRDFVRALAALRAGDVETRVNELNHALIVIAHLQNVLDHQHGGDAATTFVQFYDVTRGMIVSANMEASADILRTLIELYTSVRQAWQQIDGPASDAAKAAISAAKHETPAADTNEDDAEPLRWSA
jgi:flagellar secretion chaperone FliS